MKFRIYYEDVDAAGIVYHSNYLKYCERARSEMFFSKGLTPIIDNNSHFVVRKMLCDFISSAKFGDIVDVSTQIVEIKKASFILRQTIKVEDKVVFEAIVTLVLVNNGKPRRIDKNIEKLILSIL
jgi:acyl-CoA thioester hydrolase